MQSSIDRYRKDRENEKTETELSDKQRRLAYLQQDTSGANALEILELQKELEEGQQDYTDKLIDDKISELQDQNDEAARQRQDQIDLLQSQLDHYIESGEVWKDVYSLMENGIDENGVIIGSNLFDLLARSDEYVSKSVLEQLQWAADLKDMVAQAIQWLQVGRQLENLEMAGQSIEFTTADGHTLTGTVNDDGSVTANDGKTYNDVYQNYNGAYMTQETKGNPSERPGQIIESTQPEPPKVTESVKRGVAAAILNGNQGWGIDPGRTSKLTEIFGSEVATEIVKNYLNKGNYGGKPAEYSYEKMKAMFGVNYSGTVKSNDLGNSGPTWDAFDATYYTAEEIEDLGLSSEATSTDWIYDPSTGQWRKKIPEFATGGLADFTGPAWLDGTKSRPEYVLNSDQTRAFFTLVDVLESLRVGNPKSSENSGDNTYDIDINVESIGSDYDVEQLANTVKRLINEDARYRNNNSIGNSR